MFHIDICTYIQVGDLKLLIRRTLETSSSLGQEDRDNL